MNNQTSSRTKQINDIRELTANELEIVSGGKAQGDLRGALARLEREIKNRENLS